MQKARGQTLWRLLAPFDPRYPWRNDKLVVTYLKQHLKKPVQTRLLGCCPLAALSLRDVFAVTPVSDQQWQQEESTQETPQQPDTRQMVPPTPTPSPLMQRRETTTMTKPPKKRLRLHIPAIATTTAPPAATEGQEICLPDTQPQLYAQHIDTIVNQLLNGDETMSGYGQTEQWR
ncbi:hypothetical protein BaRGS_00030216 [Batillaria attramentaria]|uniref:Uncharacterized protein n=1 Tax=Batillaria attramentaria TaxID=370345 RepID=A0ABD0JV30_9CAEN